MNGYSKIKLMNSSSKSRSMDFSDQTIPTPSPRIQKPIPINKSTINTTNQQPKNPDHNDDDYDYDYKKYSGNLEEEDGNFPMKMLTRNRSVASGRSTTTNTNGTTTPSSRFKIEKQNSTGRALHTAVTRALSIRRSASVSERYSRIHDQYASRLDDVDHLEAQEQQENEDFHVGISKKKKSRGSILKACKRIFGL